MCPDVRVTRKGKRRAGNAWDENLAVLWERLGVYREKHLEHRFDELPDRCQTCQDWMTGAAQRFGPDECMKQ